MKFGCNLIEKYINNCKIQKFGKSDLGRTRVNVHYDVVLYREYREVMYINAHERKDDFIPETSKSTTQTENYDNI